MSSAMSPTLSELRATPRSSGRVGGRVDRRLDDVSRVYTEGHGMRAAGALACR